MRRYCPENMEVDSMKDSDSDPCENMESSGKRNFVEFIPLDGELDAVTYSEPSTTVRPILANKRNLGNSIKSSLIFSRSEFLNQTESSGQQLGSNEVSNFPIKPGLRASRRANAEKREGHLVQTQQNTTRSAEKASTSMWRSRIQADSLCKTSSSSTKKAQPYKNSTSQFQAQKITTQSTRKPSISYAQKVWREKTKNQPSTSVQRTVQVNSSSKLSPTATKRAHFQKDSSPLKVWREKIQKQPSKPSTSVQRRTLQVNSSSKRSSMATKKKTHFQKDSSPQKAWKEETKKQTSTREPKRSRNSTPTPIYHITWDGFVRTCESVTEYCRICEKDLSSPLKGRELVYDDDEYDYDFEPTILPDVSVLACGHVFHSECLDSFVTEDQSSDPMWFLCLSKCS